MTIGLTGRVADDGLAAHEARGIDLSTVASENAITGQAWIPTRDAYLERHPGCALEEEDVATEVEVRNVGIDRHQSKSELAGVCAGGANPNDNGWKRARKRRTAYASALSCSPQLTDHRQSRLADRPVDLRPT